MIERKTAEKIEMFEFALFVLIHAVYTWFFSTTDVAVKVSIYAAVTSVCAFVCLFLIKDLLRSQTLFIFCIMIATQLIGGEMGSLAMGVCIYMISGALISIVGSIKLNRRFFIITNIFIVIGLVMEYDAITKFMPIRYYGMVIMFCESFLITENLLVTIYQRKVEEVETQNGLLNVVQKEKNQFFANMSHEIRTPMNAIIGMSELIMREEDASDKIREYCYNIHSSGENLLGIINDILDFSKLESGKMDIVNENYSFASVIQDITNTAIFRKGYKDLDIIVDCSPNIPKTFVGDELRIRQILINIVNNAIKFTNEGYVFIKVNCHETDEGNFLQFQVEDSGIGIKKEDQIHLFDSFNRTDYLKNRFVEGTGLGLAICRQLVGLMHGTIKLYSEYGKGTTVIVDIPQEIADDAPFLKLNDEKNVIVGVYVDKDNHLRPGDLYYNEAMRHIWEDLNIEFKEITDFSDMIQYVDQGRITHLFIGDFEYADQKNFFDQMAKKVHLFVHHDVQKAITLSPDITEVLLPLCSLNIITAMNGEPLYNQFIDEKAVDIIFSAPEAKVLVVDDNDINLRVAEGILKLFDIHAELVHSGKEALERLKKQDIDLVLMDHMMPELDGMETTEIIRRSYNDYGRDLIVIAMTANAVNDAKNMFLTNGFQDFLPKPVTLKDLNGLLRKWLPGKKLVFKNEQDKKQIKVLLPETPRQEEEIAVTTEPTFVPMEVNEAFALENMGGMKDLYIELLEYSLEMQDERMKEIQESFDEEDYEEYQIRVHALKGAMRSLGIEEIALVAQSQENACKEKRFQDAVEGHAHFLEECDRAHESIRYYLKNL
ncbi:MAG: ATP-binding protein [Lachnospiraceae bacterium]